MSDLKERLLNRFRDPEYRHEYLESFLNSLISAQIRTLREDSQLSQADLAEKLGTAQSAISRIENPNYSAWRVDTLRKLARVFDRALIVKFVSFGDAVDDIEQFGIDRLIRPAFEDDPAFHELNGGESSANDAIALANVLPFRGKPVSPARPQSWREVYG